MTEETLLHALALLQERLTALRTRYPDLTTEEIAQALDQALQRQRASLKPSPLEHAPLFPTDFEARRYARDLLKAVIARYPDFLSAEDARRIERQYVKLVRRRAQ